MLTNLNNLLRDLLIDQVAVLASDTQVRFQPPDDDWRTVVSGLGDMALNIYLADLRENRALRSNERTYTTAGAGLLSEQAPARLDCHYLISAWSPASASPAVEPALDEHALIYQVAEVLVRSAPLNPSLVYPAGALPLLAWPEPYRDRDLPTTVAPVEGFPKLAEFWGTMGAAARWRPALYLVATLPLAYLSEITGPLVMTRITEYSRVDRPGAGQTWVQIGGTLSDPADQPVPAAWVGLERAGDLLQATTTDARGRFTFTRLAMGDYTLRVRAPGRAELVNPIQVPAPGGSYDVRF
jgi:hypothetical protein